MATRWQEQDDIAPLDLRLALPAAALWLGCVAGLWAAGSIAAALLAVSAITVWWWRRYRGGNTHTVVDNSVGLLLVLCCATGIVLGAASVAKATADPVMSAAHEGQWVTITARITAEPVAIRSSFMPQRDSTGVQQTADDDSPQQYRIAAAASQVTAGGMTFASRSVVNIFATGRDWGDLTRGMTVRAAGTVTENSFGAIPAANLRAVGLSDIVGRAPLWQRWAHPARAALARSAATISPDAGALLLGLVVGDTRAMSPELMAASKTTGLTHLVAVSGTHMAIAAGAVLLIVRRAGPRWSAFGAGCTLVSMVILVGPQPSVLRSVVMATIGLTAAVAGRSRSTLPALAAAVFALLLYDPSLAVQVGFVLSVQATAGLVLLAPVWIRGLQSRGVPGGWAMVLAIPTAAHIVTIPVIVAISGKISLVAIFANMAVTPVVAPALLLGLLCVLLSFWWPSAGAIISRIDEPLLRWITGTAHQLSRWPSASVPWSQSPAAVLLLAAILIGALWALRMAYIRIALVAALVGIVIVLFPARGVLPGWPHDGWLITACDVGQGDAFVVATGVPGSAIVVDAGPEPQLVDQCLRRLKVTHIDLVVLTHLHADHIAGLPGILANRSVQAIGVGLNREPAQAWDAIRSQTERYGIPIVDLVADTSWRVADVRLDILAPRRHFRGTESDPNNESVVVLATRDDVRILLTGDIEIPAQRDLMRSQTDLAADILKAPHHGSARLLPAFVAAVRPQIVMIGVGDGNSYGHPAGTALAAYREAGSQAVMRTDTDGDSQVITASGGLATVVRGN